MSDTVAVAKPKRQLPVWLRVVFGIIGVCAIADGISTIYRGMFSSALPACSNPQVAELVGSIYRDKKIGAPTGLVDLKRVSTIDGQRVCAGKIEFKDRGPATLTYKVYIKDDHLEVMIEKSADA